ncbi:MAG TPA: acyltransferase [Deltaproteobacteria bacterium]|nr:acyltransferase [Deltaproteobacteria bacterium]
MERITKVAAIQVVAQKDRADTLKRTTELIDIATKEGSKIVCLPQLFNLPWFAHTMDRENFNLAEDEQGTTLTSLREIAASKGIVLIAPLFEKAGDRYFNTAFVIGTDGSIIGRYRKVHVPQIPLWEERFYFSPGDTGFPVFQTPFARIGVQICWDAFFPEGFRVLALKGAEVVFVPTAAAFYHSRLKWERSLSASAHANGFFVFRVNRVGKEEKQDFYGRSFCVGPDGEFLVKPVGSSEGIVVATLDLNLINTIRNEWVFLRDRRPEVYRLIAGDDEEERT